jgi:hemoglobin
MTTTMTPVSTPDVSLYEELGGRAALRAAVDVFYRRLLADPELAWFFPNGVGDRHRAFLVTALGEALGGPERYRGPNLVDAHRDLGITHAQFDRAAAHLSCALYELGVPRPLADQVIVIVAKLRWAIVTA